MPNQKPWLKFYKNIPETINYPRVTMYEALMQTVEKIRTALLMIFSITPQRTASSRMTSTFARMRWPRSA